MATHMLKGAKVRLKANAKKGFDRQIERERERTRERRKESETDSAFFAACHVLSTAGNSRYPCVCLATHTHEQKKERGKEQAKAMAKSKSSGTIKAQSHFSIYCGNLAKRFRI